MNGTAIRYLILFLFLSVQATGLCVSVSVPGADPRPEIIEMNKNVIHLSTNLVEVKDAVDRFNHASDKATNRLIALTWLLVIFTIALVADVGFRSWKEKHAEKADRKELLSALSTSVEKNLELIRQLSDEINSRTTTYPLDLTILDATAAKKYDIGVDLETCKAVDHARYELLHLNGKLRLLLDYADELLRDELQSHMQNILAMLQRSTSEIRQLQPHMLGPLPEHVRNNFNRFKFCLLLRKSCIDHIPVVQKALENAQTRLKNVEK